MDGSQAPVRLLFRDPVFAWANIAMVLLSISFGIQLPCLVFWLQEGWGLSAVRTGLGIAPGPVMVSLTGLGLWRAGPASPRPSPRVGEPAV